MCACVSITTKVSDWIRTSKGTALGDGNFRQGTKRNGSYEDLLRGDFFLGGIRELLSFEAPSREACSSGDKC